MRKTVTERQLKEVDHHCPICNAIMIEELLNPVGPKIIFLICEICNIIADYYHIKNK